MTKSYVFIRIIAKILEESQIFTIMSHNHARIEIRISISMYILMDAKMENFAINLMDGKSLSFIQNIIKLFYDHIKLNLKTY